MKGGLLQLATVGREDSVLISNPEIFHFKKTYIPYSKFTIDNNSYNLGRKTFDTSFDFEIGKDGDLLKDLMFYVDIPYFEILKKIDNKTVIFERTESDKIYYNHNSLKSLVYYSGNNNFYVIPENMFYFKDNNAEKHTLNSNKILSINSEEYSKYFNESSQFEELEFGHKYKHDSIKYLKTLDSYWFISFMEKVVNDKKSDIVLMDYKKFTIWINNKMENTLFMDYHILFNNKNNRDLYQINFNETRPINELKKYFEISEKIDYLTQSNYINEGLDIDKTIEDIFISKDKIVTNDLETLKKSIVYSSRNILMLIMKLYDDSKENFHTMFKMYKVAEDNNNEIIDVNSKVYDIITWKNYTSKYFDVCFDNEEYDAYTSHFIDNYKTTVSLIENQIELLWTDLDLKINNKFNSDYIFTIIYTFITRYNNFNNFDTINFLDFFEKSGENTFITELKKNQNNYTDTTVTNLTNINKTYGYNLDLSLIFNYVFYSLADNIKKLDLFDNFNSISKPNIQFVYWWRNKLANIIFLRYMRMKNNSTTDSRRYYPDFESFRDSQEVINFFYTYGPNDSFTIKEVRDELYHLIHNRSYIGLYSVENVDESKYLEIEKINLIKTSTFDENKNSIVKGKFIINIKINEYSYNNNIITFNDNCKIINNFFDSNYKLYIKLNNYVYDCNFSYINSRIQLELNNSIVLVSNFDIIIEYNQPINKYYIDYNSTQIVKSDLTFNSNNIVFETTKYIDTNKFTYELESQVNPVNSDIEIYSSQADPVNATNKYNFNMDISSYLPVELFNTNYTNYSTSLYEIIEYTNGTTTNFKINSEEINSQKKNILTITSTTSNYFTLNTTSIFELEYNSKKYTITLENYETNKYIINGIDIGLLDNITNYTSYKLLESKVIVSNLGILSFINTYAYYDVSDTNGDNIFTYTGSLTDISGTQLLEYDSNYYSVNISVEDASNKIYKINTFDNITVNGAKLIFNNNIYFSNKLSTIANSANYFIAFKSTVNTSIKQPVQIIPYNYDTTESNFDISNVKFKYAIFTNQDTNYNKLISDNAYDFTINGSLKLEEKYNLYSENYNMMSNNVISFNFDDNKKYYIEEKYVSGKYIIKEISFNETNSDNYIYLNNKIDNKYIIEREYDFNDIKSIDIIEPISYYDNYNMSGKIIVENNKEYISMDISNNVENYNKFVSNYLGSYYIKYNNQIIHLSYPTISSNSLTFKFKICNESNLFTPSNTIIQFNFYSINNNYLPNLIKYTSFYPQKSNEKVYDIMDYFIQSPMILFIDNNQTKNGHIILKNLSINFDIFDKIEYLKVDSDNLFITQNIHSNQLIRYENNMISSSFDENIMYSNDENILIRENLLRIIESKLDNILERDNIGTIIETIETTDQLLRSIDLTNSLQKIGEGEYGNTSKKLLEIFNNSNITNMLGITENFDDSLTNKNSENNYNILSDINCNNYNFFSKYVLDFFGENNNVSFDKNLGYSTNIGNGKDIFYTNIKILLNEPKVNTYMKDFLYDYRVEINNQLEYINDNKLWLSLFSKSIKSGFDNFITYQQEYRNMLYINNNKEYSYDIVSDNFTSDELEKKYYINNEEISIDKVNKKFKTTQELNPIIENINSFIVKQDKGSYYDNKNKFNYHGCCLIKDNTFVIDKLDLNFITNKDYMFVDDNENCNLVIKQESKEFFKINDHIDKYLLNSTVFEIDQIQDISYNNTNVYFYEFKKNDTNSLQKNEFVIVDNYLTMVFDTSYNGNNIGIVSYNNVDLENIKYFKGTKKSSVTDTSYNILNYNLINMIDMSDTIYTFGELLDIKYCNTKLSTQPDVSLCTIENGMLNFVTYDNAYYTFLSTSKVYKLSNKILENKPLHLEDTKISYYNIHDDINDNYVYFNGNKIFTLDNKTDSVKPENIWVYKDNIYNTMDEYLVKIDITNMEIEMNQDIYDNFKNQYLYYTNNYYSFSDFSRINVSSTNLDKIYILNNCFNSMKIFYTHRERELDNIVYNKIYNKYNITNLNNMMIKNDDFRFNIDNEVDTCLNTTLLFKNNTTNNIVSRPINISLPNSDNNFNRLYYTTYSDSSFNTETDSVIKLDVSAASSGSTIGSDMFFYLVFNKFTSGSDKYTLNGVTEYKFFIDKVSKIEIINNNKFLKVENMTTNMNMFKITINKDYKYIIGNFDKISFDVIFIYNKIEYKFPIVYYLLVDSSYNQVLNYFYDSSTKLLREPLLIFDSNDVISDTSGTFAGSIPQTLKNNGSGGAILVSETISKVTVVDKNYRFEESYDKVYTDGTIKKVVTNNNNNKVQFNWELLDDVTISDNMIEDFENFEYIKSKINYLILKYNDNIYFVNILDKTDKIVIDYNFEKKIRASVFVNINNGVSYNTKIFLNQKLNIMNIQFGKINVGEVVILGKMILLIKDYDLQYNGYSYQILNPNKEEFKNSYDSYVTLGFINNYFNKHNLSFVDTDAMLVYKDTEDLITGDFIYNKNFIGIYDNTMLSYIDDSINYTFNNPSIKIHIQKLNSKWYYFGNYITGNSILLGSYKSGDDILTKLFKIKSIVNNLIEWDTDYTTFLNNLSDKSNDNFIFTAPYLPLKINKKTKIPKNGIILIKGSYYIIKDYNVINYNEGLTDDLYYMLEIENNSYTLSNITNNIEEFSEMFYKNRTIYYSDKTIVQNSNNIDTNIAQLELNSSKVFYYKKNQEYNYPVYLIKNNNSYVEDKTDTDVKYYFDPSGLTKSIIEPTNYINIDTYIYNPLYILENSKYTYPVYINDYFVINNNTTDIKTDLVNLNIPVHITNRSSSIQFTSLVQTNAIKDISYNYSIITDPSDCIIKAKTLPLWLNLNNNILSGTPTEIIDNNLIELIAEKDNISTIQKFQIVITDTSSQFSVTSNPKTNGYSDIKYEYNITANDTISSIEKQFIPNWLDLSNNKLTGTPYKNSLGLNKVSLLLKDSSGNSSLQEFNIFINLKNPIFIESMPSTILSGTSYLYNMAIKNLDNDNYTIGTNSTLPNWLNLDVSNLKIETNGNAIDNNNLVDLFIYNNDSSDIKINHSFRITDTSDIYITSKPELKCFTYSLYEYTIITNQLNYKSKLIKSPNWITLTEDHRLIGTPIMLHNDISNNIIIEVIDNNNNTFRQEFSIDVFEFNNNIIKIMGGIDNFKNNINYNSHLILNKKEIVCKGYIDYGNYKELFIFDNINFIGTVELIVPPKFEDSTIDIINNKPVMLNGSVIEYNLELKNNDKKPKLYCYYKETSQTQLRIFECDVKSIKSLVIDDKYFMSFYNDYKEKELKFYIENYIPIEIEKIIEVTNEIKKILNFNIVPFEISSQMSILIEEKNNDIVNVYNCNIKLENGFLKIDQDIENINSEFYLNRIIPIRIRNNIIQFIRPTISENHSVGVSDKQGIDEWVKIPINKITKPILENNKWKMEIKSLYLNLLLQNNIYDRISSNDDNKITLLIDSNKYYLLYSYIPNTLDDFVYIKNTNYISRLYKENSEWKPQSQLSSDIPKDKGLNTYLTDDWKIDYTFTKIPVTIKNSTSNNSYIVENYIIDNINLESSELEYYIENPNNLILNSGINNNSELEIITTNPVINTTTFIFYKIVTNKITKDNITEPFSSVKTYINKIEGMNANTHLLFNSAKPLIDWTSITFHQNSKYKIIEQTLEKYLELDSSGIVKIKDDLSNNVLLFEEVQLGSTLLNVCKLLSEDNFKKLNDLKNIRKIEYIIYEYINDECKNKLFWIDPVKNINTYLQYSPDSSNYMIHMNCVINTNELSNISNTDIFNKIDDDSIERIAYLDNQFTWKQLGSKYNIFRDINMVYSSISNFVNTNYNSYFGVNSHKLLRYLNRIYRDKDRYLDNVKNGETFNASYNLLNMEKILINKQWEYLKDNNLKFSNLLNSEFTDNIKMVYNNNKNLVYSGLKIDESFDMTTFGLDSYNKINFYNFETENVIFDDFTLEKNEIDHILKYKLESDNIYHYNIKSTQNVIFNPDFDYKLNMLEGKNIFSEESLEIIKYNSNIIEFSTNNYLDDYNKITLDVTKTYDIIDYEFNGYLYESVLIEDLSTQIFNLYYDTTEISLLNIITDASGSTFNMISNNIINNTDFVRIEKLIGIKSQEINNNKLYITFTKLFSESNIEKILDQVYIKVDNDNYMISKDGTGYYISNDNLLDLRNNFVIFGYIKITTIESKLSDKIIYKLTLNEDIDNTIFRNRAPLVINYNVDGNKIDNIDFINNRDITIFLKNEISSAYKLECKFNMEKDDPILLKSFTNNPEPYLVEIENTTKLTTNSTVSLVNDTSDISGSVFQIINRNDILFNTENRIDLHTISNYNTKIINILNITDYSLSNNILIFDLTEDITFDLISTFEYYVELDSSYQKISNDHIDLIGNNININLNSYTYTNVDPSFNFKQVNIELKSVHSYDYNFLAELDLFYKRKTIVNEKFYLNYLTNDNKEIGNYIYKIAKSTGAFNWDNLSKIISLDINNILTYTYIGEKDNMIYFATKINLNNTLIELNTEIRFDINLVKSSIDFVTYNLSEGIIYSVENDYKKKVILNVGEFNNNYQIFSDLGINLYINFYHANSDIDLIASKELSFNFPKELNYDKYEKTVVTTTTLKENVKWKKDIQYKIFDYIDFYLNDIKVDSMDKDILKISNIYLDKNKEILQDPYLYEDNFRLFVPTMFWFSQNSSNYLPLISLENTEIKIKMKLNKIKNLIDNNLNGLVTVLPRNSSINLMTDTILLGNKERKNFAEYNHEYLIERFVKYNNNILRKENELINLNVKGLVKDIFWLTESTLTGNNFLSDKVTIQDDMYIEFADIVKKYQIYYENGHSFTKDVTSIYLEKFLDYEYILTLIKTKNVISETIKIHSYLKNFDLEFVLYLFYNKFKFYDNLADSKFNTDPVKAKIARTNFKLRRLVLYFKNIYKNDITINPINPIKSIKFKANGQAILEKQTGNYFSYLTTRKLNKLEKYGMYYYTFSLFPLESQPSGHLNFNILKNPVVYLNLDKRVVDENLFLKTVVKEYQILRIIGGMASLSWN